MTWQILNPLSSASYSQGGNHHQSGEITVLGVSDTDLNSVFFLMIVLGWGWFPQHRASPFPPRPPPEVLNLGEVVLLTLFYVLLSPFLIDH